MRYPNCPRPGCRFADRGNNHDRYTDMTHCSAACRRWMTWAGIAARDGDDVAAASLMRLAEALDARKRPSDPVDGLGRGDARVTRYTATTDTDNL